jgi:HD-like signal output (HDOD) protein
MSKTATTLARAVLFVDDEKSILDSLRREFMFTDLKILTAQDAHSGMEILSKENVDVVLSDFRMPGGDGMQFLQSVKEKYPGSARIIFSGFLDKDILMRSITNGWASTFLTKPWDKDALYRKISRIFEIKASLADSELFSLLNRVYEIPTIPALYDVFVKKLGTGNSIPAEVFETIRMDPVLSAKILQLANSVFFGEREIVSIQEAVDLLQASSLREIVLTAKYPAEMNTEGIKLRHLIDIFIHGAMLIQFIPAVYAARFGKPRGKYYPSAGIVRAIGKIFLLLYYADQFGRTIAFQTAHPEKTFGESEAVLGIKNTSHIRIGRLLLDLWNFPQILLQAASDGEDEQNIGEDARRLAWAEHCTDSLVTQLTSRVDDRKIDVSRYSDENFSGETLMPLVTHMAGEIVRYRSTFTRHPYA